MILDSRRHKLSDGYAGQVFGFSVGRLCEKLGDETQLETRIASGYRLFAHLRRRLHSGKH